MPVSLEREGLPAEAGAGVDFEALAHLVCGGELGAEPLVSLLLCDDARIAEINAEWLGHPGPTDVISFPQWELTPGGGGQAGGSVPDLLGDIVISVDTAARQAADWPAPWSADHELALLFVHGLLHLLGYDDLAAPARAQMRAREDHWLAAAGWGPVPREEDTP